MTLSDTAFRDIQRKGRASDVPVSYMKRAVEDRVLDFDEAVLGFDEEMAMAEAQRCLQCPDPQPCTLSCPAGNDLPAMLWHISQGEFIEAAEIYSDIANRCVYKQNKAVYELKVCECIFESGEYDKVLSELDDFINDNKSVNKDSIGKAI